MSISNSPFFVQIRRSQPHPLPVHLHPKLRNRFVSFSPSLGNSVQTLSPIQHYKHNLQSTEAGADDRTRNAHEHRDRNSSAKSQFQHNQTLQNNQKSHNTTQPCYNLQNTKGTEKLHKPNQQAFFPNQTINFNTTRNQKYTNSQQFINNNTKHNTQTQSSPSHGRGQTVEPSQSGQVHNKTGPETRK